MQHSKEYPDVSILVINYNTFEITCNCIRSVLLKTVDVSYELILVDNGSTEVTPSTFEERFPEIIFLRSERNLGFAGGNNLGIGHAKGKFILLLNSDTVLINDAVSIAVLELRNRPEVGAMSGQLFYADGRVQAVAGRFPTLFQALFILLRIEKFISKKRKMQFLLSDYWDYSMETEADWVWGAFFIFPTILLNAFPNGKLHDNFFMYYEDVQWCYHIKRKLEKKVIYSPKPKITHLLQASGNSMAAQEHFDKKILPNQWFFLRTYKGRVYTSIYYLLLSLHQLSMRTSASRNRACVYFKLALR